MVKYKEKKKLKNIFIVFRYRITYTETKCGEIGGAKAVSSGIIRFKAERNNASPT